jgi:D-alanyl-D-alanine carboxypeptidase
MTHKLLILISLGMAILSSQNSFSQLNDTELSSLIETARKKFDVPAIAVVLANSNEIVLSEIEGVRVNNTNNMASLNDFFHIGSTTKSMNAVMAGQLVEQGKLEWQTNLFDIFPELKSESNPDYYHVTIEDLFLCKAGIKTFTSLPTRFPRLNHQFLISD